MSEVRIVRVTNPFRNEKEVEVVPYTGKPLASYLDPESNEMVVVMGEIIPPDALGTWTPLPNDEIVVRPYIAKGALRIILMAIVTVVGVLITSGAILPALTATWAAVLGAAVVIGGNLLVNAILPPNMPSLDSNRHETQTYSWSGAQMTARQGISISRGYGLFRRAPNVIASFVESIANNQYTNLLGSFGFGPALQMSNILINGNPIESYTGITLEKRLGFLNQNEVTNFHNIENDYPQQQLLTAAVGSFVVNGHRVDTTIIEVEVFFPKGLFRFDSNGNIAPVTVFWRVEVSPHGAGLWKTFYTPRTTAAVNGTDNWVAIQDDQFQGGASPIVATTTLPNPGDQVEGNQFVDDALVNAYDMDGTHTTPTIHRTGYWTKNPNNPATLNTMGASAVTATDWSSVSKATVGSQQQPMHDTLRVSGLPAGQWDVRVTKLGYFDGTATVPLGTTNKTGGDRGQTNSSDEIWLSAIREVSEDTLGFTGEILLGLRALATSQLSGSGLNITALINHGTPECAGYKNSVAYDRPLAFFRFNDASLASCVDSSGRGNHGTYNVGTGAITVQQPTLVTKSPAKSTLFNGPGGCDVSTPNLVIGSDFAIEVWIKLVALPGGASWYDLAVPTSGNGFRLYNDGKLSFDFGAAVHKSATVLAAGQTYHVAVRCKAGNLMFMINGVKDANTYAAVPATTIQLICNGMDSQVQALAVYDYALQPGRIKQHYIIGTSRINVLEDKTGDNPAIVSLDILTNYQYGGSVAYSKIDEIKWLTYANRCDELVSDGRGGQVRRHVFNGVFDQGKNLWDALLSVGLMSRAVFVRTGQKYYPVLDAPGTIAQIFGMGNMVKGSFHGSYLAQADRASAIDLSFADELNKYAKQQITVQNDADVQSGKQLAKSGAVEMFGITAECAVWREGIFKLLGNQYNIRIVQWDAWTDAVHCVVGDVVGVSHDVPKWGQSGRVRGCAGVSVRLDQPVTLNDDGTIYTLLVRLNSVQRATGNIVSIVGNIITLDAAYTGDTTVKRLIDANGADYKIIGTGANYVEVDDSTGMANTTYTVFDTDVIESRTIVVPAGSVGLVTDTLTLSSAFDIDPQQYDVYAFGGTTGYKLFRILDIGKRDDMTFTLKAVEYNGALYTDSEPVIGATKSNYSVYGPLRPATAADVVSGTDAWANPNNALLGDAVYTVAQGSVAPSTEQTHVLKVLGPNPRIAPSDVIVGLSVEVDGHQVAGAGGSVADFAIQLYVGGILAGTAKTLAAAWTNADGARVYGGPTDMWGLAQLLPSDANDAGFGVGVQLTLVTANGQPVTQAQVDAVRFTFYTSKAAEAAVTDLVVNETTALVNGLNRTTINVGWRNGKATVGANAMVSFDGAPEILYAQVIGDTSVKIHADPGQTVSGHIVGFDYQGRLSPYSSAPAFSDAVVKGPPKNLLRNSTFAGTLAGWDITWRAGDNVSRSSVNGGYAQYNIVGTALITPIVFLSQVISAGFSVGDYIMISGYIDADQVTNGFMNLVMSFTGSAGPVQKSASFDMSAASVGSQRLFSAIIQVPAGTTSIDVTGFINGNGGGNPNIAIGKKMRIGHILVERSATTFATPSAWADLDLNGNVLDIFTAGGSTNLMGQGSTVPVVTGSFSGGTKTDTTIPFSWTGLQIHWPNGAITNIQNGSITATGLVASTTYAFYPVFNLQTGQILFAGGNAGTNAPQIAVLGGPSSAANQISIQDGYVKLSQSSITVTTAAAGGSGAFPGGGGDGCPDIFQFVRHKQKGSILVREVRGGDVIYAGNGRWTKVKTIKFEPCDSWVILRLSNGQFLKQTPETRVPLIDGQLILAVDARLGLMVPGADGPALVITGVWDDVTPGTKAVISCEGPVFEFACGSETPCAITHNAMILK